MLKHGGAEPTKGVATVGTGLSARSQSCPQFAMVILALVFPDWLPKDSIFLTTSMPSTTWPNTTCLPSSLRTEQGQLTGAGEGTLTQHSSRNPPCDPYHAVFSVQMKNCDPLVFGPALAMERMPGPVCVSVKFSSANLLP